MKKMKSAFISSSSDESEYFQEKSRNKRVKITDDRLNELEKLKAKRSAKKRHSDLNFETSESESDDDSADAEKNYEDSEIDSGDESPRSKICCLLAPPLYVFS